jgi:hypothetical protein
VTETATWTTANDTGMGTKEDAVLLNCFREYPEVGEEL